MDSKKRLAYMYGAVGATTLLLFMSFHPLDLHGLAWCALVPLLLLASARERYRDVFFMGASTGFLFHLVGLGWLALCTPEGWLTTVVCEAVYMGLSVLATTYVHRKTRWPHAFILPVIWTALDFERARYKFFAFPWMLLCQTQHSQDWLIQIVDITGVYGPGFFVLMANGLILDTLLHKTRFQDYFRAENSQAPGALGPWKRILVAWGVWFALLLAAGLYGLIRLPQVRKASRPGPSLLCIQTDFPSRLDKPNLDAHTVASRVLDLTEAHFRKNLGKYDVIVWPETVWYNPIQEDYLAYLKRQRVHFEPHVRSRIDRLWNNHRRLMTLPKVARSDVIVGAIDTVWEKGRLKARHNSAFWFSSEANVQNPRGRFDKLNPVPVSEYIPGKDTLLFHWFFRIMRSMVPEGFSIFEHGKGPVTFDIKGHKVAPNICFDVSFGHTMREITKSGADIHLNMSNYSWFRSSQGLDFAVIQGKFRALESRRGVVKCVNSGPTCAFDPDGALSDEGKAYLPHIPPELLRANGRMNNEGALLTRPKTTSLMTFYVRYGDVFAWIMVLSSIAMLIKAWHCSRQTDPAG